MNLCSDKHDEICYEGRTCPLCTIREDLEKEIEDLKKAVEDLEKEGEVKDNKIEELQALIDTEADVVLKKDW